MIAIRQANLADLDAIKRIADANKDTLGFVTRPALLFGIEKGWLLVAEQEGIVGFVHYRHRRDEQTTLYELCVQADYRGQGIGRMLIEALSDEAIDAGKQSISLKAIAGIPANVFYERMGFVCVRQEVGRRRRLNVWRYEFRPLLLRERESALS